MPTVSLPPLTWTTALTAWSWHPAPIAAMLAFGLWYALRVRKLRRAGGTWPASRIVWCYSGLGSYALVTVTSIGAYQNVLFSVRAIQVVTLLMITPQFLAHALPARLARDTATPATRARCSRILHSAAMRAVTHPLIGVLVLLGVPIALYGSGWYEAGLRSHWTSELTQAALLIAGAHYFWTRLQRDPVPKLYPHVVSVGLTFAEVALDVIVPIALLMSGSLVAADYYLALNGAGGLPPDTDQTTGAAVLWGLGDLALVPFLILSMQQLRRRDKEHAAEIDAQLDQYQRAEQRRQNPTATAAETAGTAAELPATMRPWWEDDPNVAAHFRWTQQKPPQDG
ncbi:MULTISPECIES: cytochrome c oxidase assembly protein [Amycolatopsis]|uniref:Cytochrome c oxidase assembly factor CtaG n=1 Tax=Amycolatopsis echigonensis TaxID=2576905 RepID=A0A2N3WLC7_9PSEU|nr:MULTISPECIES: cytochrome c oxidase assembly protein [Amycolatopsis]MCG3751197.1 cytochrome c oxidase assembly protein [Amycolatopsis sp. Poz14]PKV94660.1 cytochrome c oxidase assembly factor CtaG [Amycolatopsis niigatensis]